jgi:phage portal protein BeeE
MLGLLQKGASLTYANREQDVQNLLTTTLNLPIVVMQETLTSLIPNPQFVRFNTAALLRSDLETRYRSYETALRAGFMTVDEVRQLEDRQPLPEGQQNV